MLTKFDIVPFAGAAVPVSTGAEPELAAYRPLRMTLAIY